MVIIFSMVCIGMAQTNNANQNKYEFAEAMIRWNGFGKWMTTEIDFGTSVNIADAKREEIQNKVRLMKNGVDIMNYMSEEGWDYVDKGLVYLQNTSWCVYTFRKLKQ